MSTFLYIILNHGFESESDCVYLMGSFEQVDLSRNAGSEDWND